MSFQAIDHDALVTVAGGQTPGQINQPQAVAAGIQGAQAGAPVGGAIGTGVGAAIAPPGFQAAGAAVGNTVGRWTGAAVGGVSGYANNVGSQIRGWFR